MKLQVQDFGLILESLRGPGNGTPGGAEKRQAVRMTLNAKLEIRPLSEKGAAGKPFTALARDISLSGIGLMQSVDLPVGTQFVITLPLGEHRGTIHLLCRVMFSQLLAEGLFGIGAEFLAMTGEQHSKPGGAGAEEQLRRVRTAVLQ